MKNFMEAGIVNHAKVLTATVISKIDLSIIIALRTSRHATAVVMLASRALRLTISGCYIAAVAG